MSDLFIPSKMLNHDIYFEKEYASLYLKEGQSLFTYRYEEGQYFLSNLAIKSPINNVCSKVVDQEIYDLETPYGYGGILTNSNDIRFLERAFMRYYERCSEEHIVCEFFRFHPFMKLPHLLKEKLDLYTLDRQVVAIKLDQEREVRWGQYSSNTRNILRKCYKTLSVSFSKNYDNFISLYYDTMKKNDASEFYYFDRTYFDKLFELEKVFLVDVKFEDRIISSGTFFRSGTLAHYHLSANSPEFYKLNGNYILLDFFAQNSAENGSSYLFLGGGRTAEPKDSLLKFKMRFSQKTLDFHLGGLVYDLETYKELNDIWQNLNPLKSPKYFQKYKLK
jgi:hypothetical protein